MRQVGWSRFFQLLDFSHTSHRCIPLHNNYSIYLGTPERAPAALISHSITVEFLLATRCRFATPPKAIGTSAGFQKSEAHGETTVVSVAS